VVGDLAVCFAAGGDCLSDLAVLRDQLAVLAPWPPLWPKAIVEGPSPEISTRWLSTPRALPAPVWVAGSDPGVELLIIDADAAFVLAHTDAKEGAARTLSTRSVRAVAGLRGPRPGAREPQAGSSGRQRPGQRHRRPDRAVEVVVAQLLTAATEQRPVLVPSDSAGASSLLARHLRERGFGFTLGMEHGRHVGQAIAA
jgi:hypothetical protein